MDYMDSNKIGQRIENKLIHALGRTISEATNDEIYKAAAECIRDDIMISWADSRKRVQEQGVKKLYYMSAEFLMGRAFSNNLISQGLYEAYREAFWEMGKCAGKIRQIAGRAGRTGSRTFTWKRRIGQTGSMFFGFTFYDGTSSTRMWDPI